MKEPTTVEAKLSTFVIWLLVVSLFGFAVGNLFPISPQPTTAPTNTPTSTIFAPAGTLGFLIQGMPDNECLWTINDTTSTHCVFTAGMARKLPIIK